MARPGIHAGPPCCAWRRLSRRFTSSVSSPHLPQRGNWSAFYTDEPHTSLVVEKLEHILGTTDSSQHSRWGRPRTRDSAQTHRPQGPIFDGWCLLQGQQLVARHSLLEDPETSAKSWVWEQGPHRDCMERSPRKKNRHTPHPLVLPGKCSC